MSTYYNDNDPKVAAWLSQLVATGQLPQGIIHASPIQEITPSEVAKHTQCHFFAGIGGWPLALRLAGWPDDVPVWTGSCPCQPFSTAGKGRGYADERHLWPIFFKLVAECRPPVVVGEQVASAAGRGWLAAVRADLEELGYAVGAADLCAAGVGAPHIRQRLYWGAVGVADHHGVGLGPWARGPRDASGRADPDGLRSDGGVGDADGKRRHELDPLLRPASSGRDARAVPQAPGAGRRLVESDHPRLEGRAPAGSGGHGRAPRSPGLDAWRDHGWVECADGRSRPTAPLARRVDDGVPGRVGLLRGFGNAIVPQVAAVFIRAVMG